MEALVHLGNGFLQVLQPMNLLVLFIGLVLGMLVAVLPGLTLVMGVLPLQFKGGDSWQSLGLTGAEVIDVLPDAALTPQSDATLVIHREDGTRQQVVVTLRIDTPIEVDYYRAGGILPYVLRQLLAGS